MDTTYNNAARRQAPNGHYNPKPGAPTNLEPAAKPAQSAMSRAEKFEDEKRRIMSTCFAKTDDQGQLLQSYITHIRVMEDAMYPSHPPPSDADPEYKKARVIIIAVKNSGRVWMHKARENDDSSFQIGKSWPMEDLKSIESFAGNVARNPEDAERARRAGNIGFVLIITKPYYWQAKTAKEKDFFLSSLVKIYRKYTSGNLPELLGFDQREKDEMLGIIAQPQDRRLPVPVPPSQEAKSSPPRSQDQRPPRQRTPSDGPNDPSKRSPSAASSSRQRPPSPLVNRLPGPDNERSRKPQYPSLDQMPQPAHHGRSVTPQLRERPSQEANVRSAPSQEQLRPSRFQSPVVNASPKLTPQSSYSNISTPSHAQDTRGESRGFPFRNEGEPGRRTPEVPVTAPIKSPHSEAFRHSPIPADRAPVSPSTIDRWRPNDQAQRPPLSHSATPPEPTPLRPNKTSSATTSTDHLPNGSWQPPERRRPPLEDAGLSGPQSDWKDNPDIPRPLGTKSVKAEDRQPLGQEPTPSQLDARIPGAFSSPSSTPPSLRRDDVPDASRKPTGPREQASKTPPPSLPNKSYTPAASPPRPETSRTATPDSLDSSVEKSPEAQFRPGLGPMTKKVSSENANRWRKATAAATAFKPRAGGAGARLLAEKAKSSNEPDGVTGVVPAPSAARSLSEEKIPQPPPALAAMEPPASPVSAQETSQLNVSVASPTPTLEIPASAENIPTPADEVKATATSRSRPSSPQPQPCLSADALNKKRTSEQYHKYLNSLDIDPLSFDNKGLNYEMILSDFSWPDNVLDLKNLERLESELRREVGRLEAGSWLGHDDQKDTRVEDFEKMLDKAITECDEMEGLLTLYGVELGVRRSEPTCETTLRNR